MPAALLIVAVLILLPSLILLFRARTRPGPPLPPGPRPFPILGNLHMLGRLPHRTLAGLAQKYGPIMSLRLGQVPAIVVSSPEAAALFLKGEHEPTFASRPAIQAARLLSYGDKGMAMSPYGEYWRRVRRMVTLHLLTPAKIAANEPLRAAEIEAAVRRLRDDAVAREVVDVGERVGELIEGIMFKMVVGKEAGKKYQLKGFVREIGALAGAFNLADFVPFLAPLDLQGLSKKMKYTSKRVDEIFENIIEDHLKEDDFGEHKDILGSMLALMANPNNEFISPFDRENVKAVMLDLFVAGIETSAITITWALAALIKNPTVMELLQKELDSNIGKERMVMELDLPKLPFLDMVVKETFRLYPVAPLLVPRESMKDVVIDGYLIPKASRVMINFWAFGRDSRIWSENAKEFYPQRFKDREIDVKGRNFELIPFGAGRRGCPGLQLGLLTIKLVLACLTHCFDWELPNSMQPEKLDMTEVFGLTVPRANKLLAIPSYRL